MTKELPRTVLITGASRGLGLAFVEGFVKAPTPPQVVVAACRNPSNATALQNVAKTYNFVKIVKMDVEIDEEIDQAVETTRSVVGNLGLCLLINNAAIYMHPKEGTLRHQSRALMQHHYSVNTTSPVIITQKFLPLLEQAASNQPDAPMGCSKAACIMICSVQGSQGNTHEKNYGSNIHYKCSKTALGMATIVIGHDLKAQGILVVAIHPGLMRTGMGSAKSNIDASESVIDILNTLPTLQEKDVGTFITRKGEKIPF